MALLCLLSCHCDHLLCLLQPRPNLPTKPYLVGLTGGIASGKTSIGKMLERLGAGVVSSDLIG